MQVAPFALTARGPECQTIRVMSKPITRVVRWLNILNQILTRCAVVDIRDADCRHENLTAFQNISIMNIFQEVKSKSFLFNM